MRQLYYLSALILCFISTSCEDNSQIDSLKEENQKIKLELSAINVKLDSLLKVKKEEEKMSSDNLSKPDISTTEKKYSTGDIGMELCQKYIEKRFPTLSFIKGEKGKSNGDCKLYRLVFEGSNSVKKLFLSVVNLSTECVYAKETSNDALHQMWDLQFIDRKNQCRCTAGNQGGRDPNNNGAEGFNKNR